MTVMTLGALLRSSIVLAAATLAFGAHAQHKLFPTDVLDDGEVDLSVSLARTQTKQDDAPHFKQTAKAAAFAARVGYGSQTHFSFSISRSDVDEEADGGLSASGKGTGASVGIRHALIEEGRVSLVLDGAVAHGKPKGARAYNTYSAGVSLGLKLASNIRPYLTAGVTLPEEDHGTTTWKLEGGAWIPVGQRVTLIPALILSRSDETHQAESGSATGLGLSALVQLGQRTYLQPSLSYARGSIGDEDGKSTAASISLYHKY